MPGASKGSVAGPCGVLAGLAAILLAIPAVAGQTNGTGASSGSALQEPYFWWTFAATLVATLIGVGLAQILTMLYANHTQREKRRDELLSELEEASKRCKDIEWLLIDANMLGMSAQQAAEYAWTPREEDLPDIGHGPAILDHKHIPEAFRGQFKLFIQRARFTHQSFTKTMTQVQDLMEAGLSAEEAWEQLEDGVREKLEKEGDELFTSTSRAIDTISDYVYTELAARIAALRSTPKARDALRAEHAVERADWNEQLREPRARPNAWFDEDPGHSS